MKKRPINEISQIILLTTGNCEIDVTAECDDLKAMGVQIDIVGVGRVNAE